MSVAIFQRINIKNTNVEGIYAVGDVTGRLASNTCSCSSRDVVYLKDYSMEKLMNT